MYQVQFFNLASELLWSTSVRVVQKVAMFSFILQPMVSCDYVNLGSRRVLKVTRTNTYQRQKPEDVR